MKQYLTIAFFLSLFAASAWAGGGRRPRPDPIPDPPSSGTMAQEHDRARTAAGLAPYRINATLARIAQAQAEYMLRTRTLTHMSDGDTWPWDRARAAGYNYAALSENIAAGQRSPREAVESWLGSTVGHRQNVLSREHIEAGYGQAGGYWCAVYARPVGEAAIQATPPSARPMAPAAPRPRFRCPRN